MKIKYLIACAAPVAVAVTLSACGSSDSSSGDTQASTYQVVLVAAQSGPLAVNGTSYLRGLDVAAAELNAQGGVLGKKVVVTALDSQGDATTAVSVLRDRLAKGPKPDLVIDGTISDETVALLPILTQAKVLSCGVTLTSKANQPSVYPYSFHVANHATDQAAAMAVKLKAAGYKKIGLFQQNDANGQTSQKGYQDALAAAGLSTVTQTYDPTALDMTAPLQSLAAQHPDAIVVTANGPASPYVLQSRLKAGITIPTFLDTSVITNIAALVPPAALKNVSLFTFAINKLIPAADRTPAERSWYSRMDAGGKISQIFFVYSASHDCLRLAAAAATQARTFDAAADAKALEHLTISGTRPYVSFSEIAFSPTDHFVSATADDYVVISPIPKVNEGTW
jgi:branched-chain amino acid transport system substrate-binding protein